eukprot:7376015-Prymnesium_polylepis.2
MRRAPRVVQDLVKDAAHPAGVAREPHAPVVVVGRFDAVHPGQRLRARAGPSAQRLCGRQAARDGQAARTSRAMIRCFCGKRPIQSTGVRPTSLMTASSSTHSTHSAPSSNASSAMRTFSK